MQSRLVAIVAVIPIIACSVFLLAQGTKPQGTARFDAASTADLSGIWAAKGAQDSDDPYRSSVSKGASTDTKHPDGYLPIGHPDAGGGLLDGPLPMQPWAKEAFDYNRDPQGFARNEMNPSYAKCYPKGPTTAWEAGVWNFEIIQSARRVFVLYEWDHEVRQIWTDGRAHPQDVGHTWMGHSIGHWDGDTLVVDTIGMNDKTWLDGAGHVHSDALHLMERLRRVDPNTMTLQMTIDDPKAYTRPFTTKIKTFQLKPKWEIEENILCEDKLLGSPIPLQ